MNFPAKDTSAAASTNPNDYEEAVIDATHIKGDDGLMAPASTGATHKLKQVVGGPVVGGPVVGGPVVGDQVVGGRRSPRASRRGGKRASRRGGSRSGKRGGKRASKRGGKRSSRRGGSRASRR